jgi:hypothetical protein
LRRSCGLAVDQIVQKIVAHFDSPADTR